MLKNIEELSGFELRELGNNIKRNYHAGRTPYEIAKQELQVVLDEADRRGKIIAKKYGKKYRPLSVHSELR